jgi:hypothetical protein
VWIRFDEDTYVVSNRWGRFTERTLRNMAAAFPEFRIGIKVASRDGA